MSESTAHWILSHKSLPKDMFNLILDHLTAIHIASWKEKINLVNQEFNKILILKLEKFQRILTIIGLKNSVKMIF
jgi:hypothetical protein